VAAAARPRPLLPRSFRRGGDGATAGSSRRAGPVGRSLCPTVEALLLAARDELEEAEALAHTGIAAAETETDNPWLQGWGYEDLATVLQRAGRTDEAREALEHALAVWERKRCLPYLVRLREQIESLGRAPANGKTRP
jgi:hypothetical protein